MQNDHGCNAKGGVTSCRARSEVRLISGLNFDLITGENTATIVAPITLRLSEVVDQRQHRLAVDRPAEGQYFIYGIASIGEPGQCLTLTAEPADR
jgi:hypothetical protein